MIKNNANINQCILYALIILSLNINGVPNQAPVITTQEEIDLELFETSNQESKPLFHFLDKTHTKVGSDTLKTILKNPLHTTPELEQRQNIIKTLTDSKTAYAIAEQLRVFKKHEDALYSLWQPQDPIQELALQEFYFNKPSLKKYNASPTGLNILQLLNVSSLSATLIEHIVMHFFISEYVKQQYHIGCNHNHSHDHEHAGSITRMIYTMYNTAHFGFHVWNLKGLYDHIKQKATVIKGMQEKLISANQCIQSMHNLYLLSKHIPNITQHLPSYIHIKNLFEEPRSLELHDTSAQLITLLSSKTFQGKASLWSNIGNTLTAFHLMKNAHTLRNALAFIGQIDAHAAIAQLYTQRASESRAYTYAQFSTHNSPHISITHVWNPYLGNACCTHSMTLGNQAPNNSIITGDNAAGKSTAIKSIALAILLAQTLTIVPAEHAYFTPFAKITTSIKHVDNIQAGASLFVAETLKAQALLDLLEQTNNTPSHFSFSIFDELFKSTNPEKGQKTAYDFISSLGKYPNSLALIATHYNQLTTLEDLSPQTFRNYFSRALPLEPNATVFELIPGTGRN